MWDKVIISSSFTIFPWNACRSNTSNKTDLAFLLLFIWNNINSESSNSTKILCTVSPCSSSGTILVAVVQYQCREMDVGTLLLIRLLALFSFTIDLTCTYLHLVVCACMHIALCSFIPCIGSCIYHPSSGTKLLHYHERTLLGYLVCLYLPTPQSPAGCPCPWQPLISPLLVLSFQESYINGSIYI